MKGVSLIVAAALFNLFAYLTIKLRPKIYGTKLFKPMIWNIKLSIAPILIQAVGLLTAIVFMIIAATFQIDFIRYIGLGIVGVTLIAWLLFLPNSAYLVTELNLTHRNADEVEVPIWYDIISVLSLSLSGVFNTILGIISIQLVYLITFDPNKINSLNRLIMTTTAIIIIVLVSIGMYLGREIRFNSWDILHPFQFIKRLFQHLKVKENRKNMVLFIVFHSIFLWLMYLSFGTSFY
ncbi:DUF1361 domain-containing protein [Erysipelothrix urinaevulpis]|uniref:DUF1361 domain-containing protein n=1 Tax=Erysipelothrix urinaevulpis TaxID=2683717 RepID=UPI001359E09B|nr:DUF1361 domain-containing protein [Erysipelothrix urinaevulpis]